MESPLEGRVTWKARSNLKIKDSKFWDVPDTDILIFRHFFPTAYTWPTADRSKVKTDVWGTASGGQIFPLDN